VKLESLYPETLCIWIYRSRNCGYSGPFPTCEKTIEDCSCHDNQERFGGIPDVGLD
jgi:phage-related protein